MELYIGLVNQDLILNTAEPHRFIALLYLLVLPLTASSLQVKGFQICQWDPGWRTFSSAFGVSSLYRLLLRPFSATPGEESWQSDFTVPHMSTMLMLVRSQRLGSQPWLPLPVTFCMCGWVYLCVCGFFFPPSFMFAFDAEWQGNPEPPTSSCCLYFSSPLSCSVFCPSGFSEQPSDFLRLWSRRSDTLYIMACAMLKGLITLPLISLQLHRGHLIQWTCSVYHQYLSASAVLKVKTGCGWHSAPFVFRPVCCTLRHVCSGIICGNLASSFAEGDTSSKEDFVSLSRQA